MDEKIPNDVNEPQVPEQAPVAPTHENDDAQRFAWPVLRWCQCLRCIAGQQPQTKGRSAATQFLHKLFDGNAQRSGLHG